MGLTEKVSLCLLGLFLLAAMFRLFAAPLKLAVKVLVNTLLGFAALAVVHFAAPLTGVTLGLNLWNAVTIGVLGLPGLGLLVLLQLMFV